MLDAATYPHPATNPQVIETHLSRIFLAGRLAYKVRRSVELDFVDFPTLLVRQIDCEEECRLSRRLAPALYLGIVSVSNDPTTGITRVNGQGTPGEYTVCVHRFAQQGVLIALARDGQLRPKEIGTLVDLITDFRTTAPVVSASSDDGTSSGIRRTLEDCTIGATTLGYAPLDAATTVSLLHQHTVRLEETFTLRRRSRHIRECYGNLYLGNTVSIDGQLTPFDCLKFSPLLRWIDTVHDTAFLFMGLLAAGLDGLVYRLINCYLERCGDYGGLAVLPFYIATRVLVRARVLFRHAHQLGGVPDETANLRGKVSRVLALSRHLLRRGDACVLLVHGLSGNGKSTRTVQLAQTRGMTRIRFDVRRQRRWHVHIVDRYPPHVVERTYRRLAAACKLGADAGLPMIADATSLAEHQRRRFFSLGRRLGAAVAIIDCVVDVDTLRTCIRNHMRGGRNASETDLYMLDVQVATQEPFNADERAHVIPDEMSRVVPYIESRER